jgi:hypothetical protein
MVTRLRYFELEPEVPGGWGANAARERPSGARADFIGNDLHQVVEWSVERAAI